MVVARYEPQESDLLPPDLVERIGEIRRSDLQRLEMASPRLRRYLKASLVLLLIPQLGGSKIRFDPSRGIYLLPDGSTVSASELRDLVDIARGEYTTKLEVATARFLNGEITLAEWQEALSEETKTHHMIVAALAFGGIAAIATNILGPRLWRQVGENLRDHLARVAGFAAAISSGKKTPLQIRAYVRYLGKSVNGAYSRARKFLMESIGLNEGRRLLDPTARHCPDCPGYATDGWVAISDIVPVGHACACNGNCRCSVQYRFNPARSLADLIE